jgi:hypothetical protein
MFFGGLGGGYSLPPPRLNKLTIGAGNTTIRAGRAGYAIAFDAPQIAQLTGDLLWRHHALSLNSWD